MSNIKDFIGGSSGMGNAVTDISLLPIHCITSGTYLKDGNAVKNTLGSFDAWVSLADRGAVRSLSWVADTWYTIADITGNGKLYNIIGAINDTLSRDVTLRVTVDGEEQVIGPLTIDTNDRLFVGAWFAGAAANSTQPIDSSYAGWGVGSYNAEGFQTKGVGDLPSPTALGYIPDQVESEALGCLYLRFGQSLKVELKTSVDYSGSIAQNAACTYQILGA